MFRELGNEAYLSAQLEKALDYYTVGLVLTPNDSVLLNNRSKSYFDLGDYKVIVYVSVNASMDICYAYTYTRISYAYTYTYLMLTYM